jgi:hypothetical protein
MMLFADRNPCAGECTFGFGLLDTVGVPTRLKQLGHNEVPIYKAEFFDNIIKEAIC